MRQLQRVSPRIEGVEETMKIRRLEKEEHQVVRSLYEEVFSEDSTSFVDYYFTEKTKDNVIYVLEEEGAVRSMLHLNPYQIKVNGIEKTAHYIVAVATQENWRKRGYMKALIRKALKDMYQDGENFTFLMPAAEAIYLPHDFRTVYEQEKRYFHGEGEPLKIEEAGELAELAESYLSAHYQVYAKRNAAYYERLMKEYASDGGRLMVIKDGGRITDCLIDVPDFERAEKEKPKIMVRIVDARRMLMSLRLTSLMAVCFQITDPVIEENNRCVVLTGTEFSGAMLMEGKRVNSEGKITIAALTSLVFGAKTVEEVCEEDGVSMTERMKKEMSKIIPLSDIYLNETV